MRGYQGREIHVSTGAKVLAALALAAFLVPIVVVLVSATRS
jgi:hypothetical protein